MDTQIRRMAGDSGWPENVVFSLSLLYLFVLPWQASIPFVAGAQRVGAFFALLLCGAWFVLVIHRRAIRKPHPFHLVFAVFIGMHVLSMLWTVDVARTTESVLLFAMIGSMTYVYWDLYDTQSAIEFGLQALLLGIFVAAVLVLVVHVTSSGHISRRDFGFTNFNATAISRLFVFGLPIAAFLYVSSEGLRSTVWKTLNASYIPVGTGAIIVTGSRQAFVLLVALTVLFVFMLVYKWNRIYNQHPRTTVLMLASLPGVAFVAPQLGRFELFERFFTIRSAIQEGTLNNRVLLWEAGVDAIVHQPWIGTGSGTFPTIIESYLIANGHNLDDFLSVIYPHNIFVGTAVETGVIGLVALTVSLLIVAREVINADESTLFTGTLLLSWLVLSTVADLQNYVIPWLLLALLLAILSVSERSRYWTTSDAKAATRQYCRRLRPNVRN